jgi:hypothetical protein
MRMQVLKFADTALMMADHEGKDPSSLKIIDSSQNEEGASDQQICNM